MSKPPWQNRFRPRPQMRDTGDRTIDPERDNSLSGTLTHALVSELVSGRLTLHAARSRAAEMLRGRVPQSRATSLAQRVSTSAIYYVRHLRPNADWRLLGTEVAFTAGKVDLVWQHHHNGSVLIDELKSGAVSLVTSATFEQLERYRRAGVEGWGADFLGVRLLHLQHPHRSIFLTPVGSFHYFESRWNLMPEGMQ